MKTTFHRLGFANNSSSAHSLVFSKKLSGTDVNCPDFNFCWDDFIVGSKKAKLRYMFAQLQYEWESYNSFGDTLLSYDQQKDVSSKYFYEFLESIPIFSEIVEENLYEYEDINVDHQSAIRIPLRRNSFRGNPEEFFNMQFFVDLTKCIVENPFVILGGNDNEEGKYSSNDYDEKEEFKEIKSLWYFLKDKDRYYSVCEYDKVTGEYVISARSGDIRKISFLKDAPLSNKSSFPYLVDIKVTDQCNNNCKYCYMDSKPDGKTVKDPFAFYMISNALKEANVMEVVLSGGEATTYLEPFDKNDLSKGGRHIDHVANYFHNQNFKVGLTTRNYKIYKESFWSELCKSIDSLAVSCSNAKEVELVRKIDYEFSMEKSKYTNRFQFSVQYILGCEDIISFRIFLKACSKNNIRNVTLLGPKNFGRGKNVNWYDLGTVWINDVKKASEEYWMNIGVDSVLSKQYKNELIESGVKEYHLTCEEGKSTCFIDVVNNYIRPSSFTNEGVEIDLSRLNAKKFLDIFSKF